MSDMEEHTRMASLRSLTLKSKFIRQFEFVENVEYIYGKCSPLTFPYISS